MGQRYTVGWTIEQLEREIRLTRMTIAVVWVALIATVLAVGIAMLL